MEQINEFKRAFELFDKDGKGRITSSDLKLVLDTVGQEITNAESDKMVI